MSDAEKILALRNALFLAEDILKMGPPYNPMVFYVIEQTLKQTGEERKDGF